ncbi:aspartyl/asparaginyl beta-hydroxylase domain-containing protein [Aliidiomarina soli]|uniref:Aspartyl beta-hydroxylase n=1 Tax=Aliidiomarina soli TaxID=1928574 RepID=A0A432WH15_9GAMM|nr:aspartyl/asparaginyl beta-hydroxylase domain-containing protein [Aliidiomarina soli]RUO32997.1 aspartyl beta-hydroxylase [Aliidiomarina soli]
MTTQQQPPTEEGLKQLLHAKDYAAALLVTERLLTRNAKDERLLLMLGRLYELIESSMDPQALYTRVVDEVPCAYNTHLMLGRYYDSRKDVEGAFKHYVFALRTANGEGFWLNSESTAPWAHKLVARAVDYAEQHRRDVMEGWISDLEKEFGADEIERVSKGIRMYSGEIPKVYEDPRQQPGFLYIPGLPAKPVFDRSDLDFIDYYESQFETIKSELDALISQNIHIENYRDEDKHGLTEGGDWDAKFFYRHGQRYDDTHSQCPKTSEVLSNLPLVHINDHSPEVCFSVLQPGAHLLPHRGITNSRSVLHMGLQIPPNCALNVVDIEQLNWQPGKVFAFDDNYLHEAWNRSDESRYVLLADIWNPFLRDSEKAAISKFVETVGILNRKYPAQPISAI